MQKDELAYVLITPYTIRKSRTGGVIARLLARSKSDLVAARMFSPGKKLIEEYTKAIKEADYEGEDPLIRDLLIKYIRDNFSRNSETGNKNRVMFLLFKGKDAIREMKNNVVGHITRFTVSGETIRDTYGDLILDRNGKVKYLEPAVLVIPPSQRSAEKELKIWQKYSDTDGGVLENIEEYPEGKKPEKTLVLIKPDNFDSPTIRVGNIIDMFSKTGLYIIGAKVIRMSIAQALEFYGPVKKVFETKFVDRVYNKADEALSSVLDFDIPEEIMQNLAKALTPHFAEHEFDKIIAFMSGSPSREVPEKDWDKPGTSKCLALIYEGMDAVNKIRNVLGSTDPTK
ncbi:MAG: nucleoside-diphosphate kinase, partial [Candidatus Theseobacter exili]|nr:nucleoside-diphosphate kinase [Candidatus Theseobacter exili]